MSSSLSSSVLAFLSLGLNALKLDIFVTSISLKLYDLLVGGLVPRKVGVDDSVDDHNDDNDVEGVEQPVVNHLVVSRLWDHLDYGGLDCSHHHHDCDGNHDSILNTVCKYSFGGKGEFST